VATPQCIKPQSYETVTKKGKIFNKENYSLQGRLLKTAYQKALLARGRQLRGRPAAHKLQGS